jgi:CRP-like cAMP-binding protein
MTHVDIMWDDPAIALMFRRFASFSRLIRFDRLERQLSVAVIDAKPRFRRLQAGRTLVEQGERDEELFLLFDGVLQVEIDGKPVTQVAQGALGEMALLSEGRRMATLRAVTPCRVAVVPKDRIDRKAMEEIAKGRMPSPGH